MYGPWLWSSRTVGADQVSGKCRAEASSGNGVLCAQGYGSLGLGGGTGSGGIGSRLLWARQHRRVRLGSHRRAAGLRSRRSGQDGEYGT